MLEAGRQWHSLLEVLIDQDDHVYINDSDLNDLMITVNGYVAVAKRL